MTASSLEYVSLPIDIVERCYVYFCSVYIHVYHNIYPASVNQLCIVTCPAVLSLPLPPTIWISLIPRPLPKSGLIYILFLYFIILRLTHIYSFPLSLTHSINAEPNSRAPCMLFCGYKDICRRSMLAK